jgi:hypothetical protein
MSPHYLGCPLRQRETLRPHSDAFLIFPERGRFSRHLDGDRGTLEERLE